jgi:F-type H+-transporting ATPase subunit alpha
MPLAKQVMILYAVVNGYLDDVPVDRVKAFEDGFHRFMDSAHPQIGEKIATEKVLSPETEEVLKAAILEFKRTVPY